MLHGKSKGKTKHLLEFTHKPPAQRYNCSFWLVWKFPNRGITERCRFDEQACSIVKVTTFSTLVTFIRIFLLKLAQKYYLHCLSVSVSQLWQVYFAAHSHSKKTSGMLGSGSKQLCCREEGQPLGHNTGLSNSSSSTFGSLKIAQTEVNYSDMLYFSVWG